MIVVTGATGALNGATVEHLLTRLSADRIGISARDVDRAQHFADRGLRVRRGSYEDPVALRESFAGATQVLLVSANDPAADMVGLHRNAIEAAAAAGVERILYTSQQGAVGSPYPPAQVHAATEEILANSGVPWTALRYGFFGSLDHLLGPWQRTGEMALPEAGPIPWVDRRDLAEAAAVVLADERPVEGPVTLTTLRPATLEDIATIASELTDRTIQRVVTDDEGWIAQEVAGGTPEPIARLALTMFQATRGDHYAAAEPLLTELLGREPRSVADQLREHLAA